MIDIEYIYSMGHRCNCPDFLKYYKIRNISGPFDYLYIDIETCFENIQNNFKLFFNDLVSFMKKSNNLRIHNSNQQINNKLNILNESDNIYYMAQNYNNTNLVINQNYIDNVSNDLYNWDRICISTHHNLVNPKTYKMIKERTDIFMDIYSHFAEKMILFHFTKINEDDNLNNYKEYIFKLKEKYNIKCYIVIMVHSCVLENSEYFENNVLFIIKKVNSYNVQYETKGIDNNKLKYTREIQVLNKYFKLNLKSYEEIKTQYNVKHFIPSRKLI
tara:strand:- start:60 stop:878 length:819 start_codon:yes stop_codon:yes gene_type:complete